MQRSERRVSRSVPGMGLYCYHHLTDVGYLICAGHQDFLHAIRHSELGPGRICTHQYRRDRSREQSSVSERYCCEWRCCTNVVLIIIIIIIINALRAHIIINLNALFYTYMEDNLNNWNNLQKALYGNTHTHTPTHPHTHTHTMNVAGTEYWY